MTAESDTRLIARLTAERDEHILAHKLMAAQFRIMQREKEHGWQEADKHEARADAALAELDQARQALQRVEDRLERIKDLCYSTTEAVGRFDVIRCADVLDRIFGAAGPVGVPAERPDKCNCGHLRSDHFTSEPSSCRFSACHCGSLGPVAEPLVADPPTKETNV